MKLAQLLESRSLLAARGRPYPDKYDMGVNILNSGLDSLEGSPRVIENGDFDCSTNRLKTLKFAPTSVDGNFNCSNNKIASLEHAPTMVDGNFICSYNRLVNLVGMSSSITLSFDCSNNDLKTLEGCPDVIGKDFDCSYNELHTLKGGPQQVSRNFNCSKNDLTSLEGAPQVVNGDFTAEYNFLESLKDIHKHIHEIKYNFYLCGNNIKSHVLGLLKIKGLNRVYMDGEATIKHRKYTDADGESSTVEAIINKHLAGERNIFDCQEELIDAGYEEFAQL